MYESIAGIMYWKGIVLSDNEVVELLNGPSSEPDEVDRVIISQLVDPEQEVLRLKDENRELKEKAKAWDDLEALVKECDSDRFDFRINLHNISITHYGDTLTHFGDFFSKKAVSNALESIRGES